jgi:uncharacterized protein YndB with AHSA1/START domain
VKTVRTFDVQTIEIAAPFEEVFPYIADAAHLPEWTHAFRAVSSGHATMATPKGSIEVELETTARREAGTVDWRMTFPDGSSGRAFSRVIAVAPERTLYSFVLLAPPVPTEQLEGTLAEQSKILAEELATLRKRLTREP